MIAGFTGATEGFPRTGEGFCADLTVRCKKLPLSGELASRSDA